MTRLRRRQEFHELRDEIHRRGLRFLDVADHLRIHESTFSRQLRGLSAVPATFERDVQSAIKELARGKRGRRRTASAAGPAVSIDCTPHKDENALDALIGRVERAWSAYRRESGGPRYRSGTVAEWQADEQRDGDAWWRILRAEIPAEAPALLALAADSRVAETELMYEAGTVLEAIVIAVEGLVMEAIDGDAPARAA